MARDLPHPGTDDADSPGLDRRASAPSSVEAKMAAYERLALGSRPVPPESDPEADAPSASATTAERTEYDSHDLTKGWTDPDPTRQRIHAKMDALERRSPSFTEQTIGIRSPNHRRGNPTDPPGPSPHSAPYGPYPNSAKPTCGATRTA